MVEEVPLHMDQELLQELDQDQVVMDLVVQVMDLVVEVRKDIVEFNQMVVLGELMEMLEDLHHQDLLIMVLVEVDQAVLEAQENHKVEMVELVQEHLLPLEIHHLLLDQLVVV
jgi:NAD-dependent SIR2 family protein deacetylase